MDELVKQVQILVQTVTTMTARLDQGFKRQEDLLVLNQDLANKLQISIDNFQVTTKALEKSLGDSESQLDDLAKIVAALLQIQQEAARSE